MIAHIITPTGMTLFINGEVININKNSEKFSFILEAFDDGLSGKSLEEEILCILDSQPDVDESFSDDLTEFEGIKMHPFFVSKMKKLYDEGYPTVSIKEFFNNYSENPSFELINRENIAKNDFGLFDFLSVKELPITEDGCFLAYKGVNDDFYSINGNTNTRILSGAVNKEGKVLNSIGSVIECHRGDVDPSREACSSHGLHVGSLEYARGWAGCGGKVLVVKVNPKDVVSVPERESCKCRVCKYEVVQEVESEILSPVVSVENGQVEEPSNDWRKFVDRVKGYLDKKYEEAGELQCIEKARLSVRQIQNSFSPDYPSKTKVLAALQELGETVIDDCINL